MDTEKPLIEESDVWAQEQYHFHGQRANEKVLLVRNQHWVILLPVILGALVSLVLPYGIWHLTAGMVRFGLLAIYTLVLAFFVARDVYAFFNSVSILSDQRIINVDQRGFFNRHITEAELAKIQDVSSDIKGILHTLFGFGDVTIRTASNSILTLPNIADPYDIQQAIVRALKGVKQD